MMIAKGSTGAGEVYARPTVPEQAPAAVFAAHCARGELAYQLAPDGSAVFPPRLAEPGTGAPLRWALSAGAGTIYSTTVVRRRGEEPSSIVLVTLDEGFRMMSTVVDRDPEDVAIGDRVRVRFGNDDVPVFVMA
jgi:uncharacterized OB-fold protein